MEPPADGKRRTRNRAGLRELQWKSAGLLGWLMALAAGCVPIGHHHAAAHEWSRYLVGKTSEAEASLVAMRDDEEAKFLLANIALAHGARDRAASLTAELRGRHPEDVELQLLEHLVRRREEHPAESWLDSYGEAWRALSRPALPNAFTASGWVTFSEPELPVPEATRRAVKGTPLQLLVDWGPCIREKRSDRVGAMVREPLPPDLRVLALRCVQYHHPGKGMDARRKELEDQVALDFPESVEVGLPALADDLDGDGPLPPRALDRLQRLLSRPVFSLPRGRLYESYRERLQAAGLPQPEVRALFALVFADFDFSVALLRHPLVRTMRAGDPDTSIRAAALSEQLAHSLLRDRRALSWLQAVPFEWGAGRAGDGAAQERAVTIRDFMRKLIPDASSAATTALAWPIPSLNQEVADAEGTDEIGLLARLAGEEIPPAILRHFIITEPPPAG